MAHQQLYIGLMSGTSMDNIDAVAMEISEGKTKVKCSSSLEIPKTVKDAVLRVCHGGTLESYFETDVLMGELFAQAALELMSKNSIKPSAIRAIGSHGQTVRHSPPRDTNISYSKQIGDPNTIFARTGCTVVADFRQADIAHGGQGAPLVPAFHDEVFRDPDKHRVIVNIGGIANITSLNANHCCLGFDTGPGNTLLDAWCNRHLGLPFDNNGEWAASGTVCESLLQKLKSHPFFSWPSPKSTGLETFNLGWLDHELADLNISSKAIEPKDIQASISALTAHTISDSIKGLEMKADEVFICGGGAKNSLVMSMIEQNLEGIPLDTTTSLGIDPEWVEAAAFAWLAMRRVENLPGNLPTVTGASDSVLLGGVYGG